MNAGLAAQGITGVSIKQAFQPTNQGMNSGPTLYLHKLGDHRYGYLNRTDVWDAAHSQMVHTERQIYETMFQCTALSIQDPTNINGTTASDLANAAVSIMQSDVTVNALLAQSIGIYRVTDVRNPYFVDDKQRYEANPSFDFTLQHEQIIVTTTPQITSFDFNLKRV